MKLGLGSIFDTGHFMAHGHCYLWNPSLVRLHVISDLSIGIAYAAISLTLLYLVRCARREIPFHWMFLAFGGFIIACGCTHLMEVWTIWTPVYWLSGGVKAVTAIASVTTALVLPSLVPKSLVLIRNARTAEDRRLELEKANLALHKEVAERERMAASVRKLNEELEQRVQARTAQLAAANERLAQKADIVSHSNDAIFSVTLDGVITSWNPSAERTYGYLASQIVGREHSVLIPAGRQLELAAVMQRIVRGELPGSFETVRLRQDGTLIDVHLSMSPVRDASGKVRGASIIARDITDQKRAQQQLQETQKLESLGLIAGGVAHDFNNLLVGILGNASLALETIERHDPNYGLLSNVVLAGEKASHLTQQMLAYAGKGKFVIQKIDLSELVCEIGRLVRPSISRLIELRLELEDSLAPIEADPSQIQQVVMNLLINGAEAIGDDVSGIVTARTGVVHMDQPLSNPGTEPLPPGTYVVLEVQDTGSGMDAETRSKIFDPFFTTKFTGRGLGLAAVLGIVRSHHGLITVESTSGHGATFKVYLPAPVQKLVHDKPADAPHASGSTGTVLVVDDEQLVRSTVRNALERRGYKVLTAEDGRAGVELFRERADEISVVILDLTMPVMSGQEALRHMQSLRPQTPIIVSSGYGESETVRRFSSDGIRAFIQKPYSAATLAKVVDRVLSSEPEPEPSARSD